MSRAEHRSPIARGPLAVAAIVLGLAVPSGRASAVEHDAIASGDAVELNAVTAAGVIARSQATSAAERLVEYTREDLCGTQRSGAWNTLCTGYDPNTPLPDCAGEQPVPPVWRRQRATPTSPWQTPTLALGWTCPQDAVPVLSEADFRRLPLAPGPLTTQPGGGSVLVGVPTIVYTDPAPQRLETTLLGVPVEVEATPTAFTWDFGDGAPPVVTTSAGHPYPDHDVDHAYGRVGTYVVTLTTEYSGRYRLVGTAAWLPVVGTATTTTASPPLTAEERRTHLVAADCRDDPHGPGC